MENEVSKDIRVFIASSNDLKQERIDLENLVSREGYTPVVWENIDHSITQEKFQDRINDDHLTTSDIVIFMVKSKLGEFTQEEFEVAYKNLGKNIKKMYIYFFDIDKNHIPKKELRKILFLQEFLEDSGNLYTEVKDFTELKAHFLEQKKFFDQDNIEVQKSEEEKESIVHIPKICIYTASPLNNKIDYKMNTIFKLFKNYKLELTHKVLNENELLEFKEFDFNLIFSNANKEKIIIEDEYFIQKSISLIQLEEIIDTENTILFLDNIIENSQFDIRKNINKNIVNFLHEKFKDHKGHITIHHLKTELPYDIDVSKLNGFIGRQNDIEAVTRKILTIKDEHKILNIKGAGGLGKTTLISKVVSEIAKRGKYKDGIEFVRCEYIKDYESFENKITFAFNMSNARNFKEQLKSLYDDEDRLIILDNIETLLHLDDTKMIIELIHFISNYATIVTTSRELLKENGFEEVYLLKEFSTDEAEELFTNIYNKMKKYNKKQLRIEILENLLSNNPLAITLVANNLSKGKTTQQIKKELDDNFISMTTKDLEDIFDRDSDNNIQRLESLFASINYSYIQLSQKEKLAIELLSLFPDGIHFENFRKFYNQKLDKKIANKDEKIKKLKEIQVIKTESFSDKNLKSLEDKSLIVNNNQHINLQSIIGRFAHFKFNNKSEDKKIEFYEKAYLYNSYLLKLIEDRSIPNFIRARIFDENKNNFLKSLQYLKYLDLDYDKYDFIKGIVNNFVYSSPNKKIFKRLTELKNINNKDKIKKDFFDILILALNYFYYNFDDVYNTICEKYPIKKIIESYQQYKEMELLNINMLLTIYDMEGYQLEHARLKLLKERLLSSIFRIGEFNNSELYLKNYYISNQSFEFEFKLYSGTLDIQRLKKYITSLHKTQIIEKVQSVFILLKADKSEVKLRTINKLVVTNPFTDGLRTLMLAIKDDENCSKTMYEEAIEKLYHIKYYHVEAIYLYSKYLKEKGDYEYNKWFGKGKELSIKHHYRFLQHQFNCLERGIEIPYDEKDYPLAEPLDFSGVIKKYGLKD